MMAGVLKRLLKKGMTRPMKRKIIAAILACVLLLCIAACGTNDDGGTNSPNTQPSESGSAQNSGGSENAQNSEPDDDDDGEFMTFEDVPSLEWIFADDDPADLRLSLRRPDGALPAGASYPGASTAIGDLVFFGAMNWRVLAVEDGKALLICERFVDFRPYRYDDEGPDGWAKSGVRDWLNGRFYDGTFTDEEMAQIVETKLSNTANPWFNTEGCEDTTDNVFLLSIEEVVRYFGDSGKLDAHTDRDVWVLYDEYDQSRVAQYIDGDMAAWWWLRSPGMNFMYAATISIDGSMNISGDYVVSGGGGVRPAIWIVL